MPPESKGRASHISSRSFGQAPPAALPPDTAGGGDSQRRSIADPDGAGDAGTDDLSHSEDSIGEWDEGYGDSDYEEEYVDGPAEWAEVDERQLREAALHLSPLGGPAKAEAPARALGGFPKDAEYLDPLGLGGVDVKAAMLVCLPLSSCVCLRDPAAVSKPTVQSWLDLLITYSPFLP
jgi:hypothetical protein